MTATERIERLPHGYNNKTSLTNGVVTKSYVGTNARHIAHHEARILRDIHGRVPVPRVLDIDLERATIELECLAGTNAQALLGDDERTRSVLRECGRIAALIATTDPTDMGFDGAGVLVHGDFGPHNLIVDDDTTQTVGVLDWEWARPGEPDEDIAWCEWIVRYHHPDQVGALDALYDGYGRRIAWPRRHRLMLENCERGLQRARDGGDKQNITGWQERLISTQALIELPTLARQTNST